MSTITFKSPFRTYTCDLIYSRYIVNQRISITLIDHVYKTPIAIATVNIPNIDLNYNEVAIKNWAENKGILETLIEAGIITKPHKQIKLNEFVTADICFLTDGLEILKNLLTKNKYPNSELDIITVNNY